MATTKATTALAKVEDLQAPIPISAKLHRRALIVQDRLIELYDLSQRNFIEIGSLIIEAEDNKLWSQLEDQEGVQYKSFDHWLSTALPYGRSTCYAARTFLREMSGVPAETLKEIPRTNIKPLLMLPAPKRKSPRWLRAASTMTHALFNKEIREVLPADSKAKVRSITKESRVALMFTKPSLKIFDRAMNRATDELSSKGITATREMAAEHICRSYLEATQPAKRKAG